MKLRIIAGLYGGRIISAPEGTATHPMSERVRNAMFNIIGPAIKGSTVLDVFAGTGAIGIEAISRGASHATLIERDRSAVASIQKNLDVLSIDDEVAVIHTPVEEWLKDDNPTYDFIFVDPPYDDMQLSTVMHLTGLLKPNGLMVLSYPGRGEAPTGTNGVVVVDNRSYGTAAIAFYRQKDAE